MKPRLYECSRRNALRLGARGLVGLSLPVLCGPGVLPFAWGEEAAPPAQHFPRMVQEYLAARVRDVEEEADRRRARVRTRRDALAYVKDVRRRIALCFGPWPAKTPLNARVTGILRRDAYRIEKVIFESRPGFLVTAHLYVPEGREFPLPGVLATCGHTSNGKSGYQEFAQGLARQGYVVFIFDPIGQGERMQYPDERGRSRYGLGVREHLQAGNQQVLVGEVLASWFAWDGIRAMDYLLSREEVDPRRVGVTGNSGGGTQTTWLCGVEDRMTMAAPSCFVTTLRRNLENELPADTEQCPPGALALGLDHSDFLAAQAPRPILILGKEKDFFDVRGVETAYRRLKSLYRLLGAEENIGLFVGPTPHGFTQENREAMYHWFNEAIGYPQLEQEPDIVLQDDKTLWCTPEGQVHLLDSKPVWAFTAEKSRALRERRRAPKTPRELQRRVRDVHALPGEAAPPEYRVLRPRSTPGYPKPHASVHAVESEPGVFAIVYRLSDERIHSRPPRGKRALLYVSHQSADLELREDAWLRECLLSEAGASLFACDVRGIGESRPSTTARDAYADPYGPDFQHASYSLMLDEPVLGRRTWDVLRVLDWLGMFGHDDVHLVGQGWGALPATFAALFSERVARVTLRHAPASYADIAETETYRWPLSALPFGLLLEFDLPDCYRVLQARGLVQIDPLGAKP